MKKVTVQLVDDLDGKVIEEGSGRSLTFALNGESFEIDLSEHNERQLRQALDPFITAARATRKPQRSPKPGKSSDPSELQAIRDWARANGIQVSDRGRISATVREAHAASN